MFVGGIYIGSRVLITFGAELLWLGLSAAMLVIVNCASLEDPLTLTTLLCQTSGVVGLYIATFYVMDLYDSAVMTSIRVQLLNLIEAIGVLFIIIGAVTSSTQFLSFDPRLLLAHTLLTVIFVLTARLVIERSAQSKNPTSLLGVIAGDRLRDQIAAENERRKDLGLDFLWMGASLEIAHSSLARIKDDQSYPRKILIDGKLLDARCAVQFLEFCSERKIQIEDLRFFSEHTYGKVAPGPDAICDWATFRMMSMSELGRAVRRLRDLSLACVGLIFSLPLALLTMVAIKCESSGPAIYTQQRIGENGRLFTMLKFRSMYQEKAPPSGASSWSTGDADPRVTRAGKVMRLLHFDELPQLINVIRGEMSLVGPRPFHPLQVAELMSTLPYFGLRHLVKPGITGWAQIGCDYAASVENRSEVFARDLYYIKHASLLFDLQILLMTVRVCIWRRGAR